MPIINVPEGKTLRFKQNGKDILSEFGVNLILESATTMSITSNFSNLVNAPSNLAGRLAASLIKGTDSEWLIEKTAWMSGAAKALGFQMWTGTEPLTATFMVELYPDPGKAKNMLGAVELLLKQMVPTESTKTGFFSLMPGPSITAAYNNKEDDPHKLNCYIGNIPMYNVIITNVDPTVSNEVDSDGIPMSVSLSITVRSVLMVTDKMVHTLFGSL